MPKSSRTVASPRATEIVPAMRAGPQGMKYGSPQHGMRTTICAHGSAVGAPSLRANPPSQPAQMMHGPAKALAVTSITRAISHRVMRRVLRVIVLTSTARLGTGG